MSERRTTPRKPLGDFVTAIIDDKPRLCLAVDISESGIFLRSAGAISRELSAHSGPVLVKFEVEGSPHWACARTRRTGSSNDGAGNGLQFTVLPDTAREALRTYAA